MNSGVDGHGCSLFCVVGLNDEESGHSYHAMEFSITKKLAKNPSLQDFNSKSIINRGISLLTMMFYVGFVMLDIKNDDTF